MSLSWLAADWPAPHGVVAGTTRRSGGRSTKQYASLNLGGHVGDDPQAVADNRKMFRQHCDLPADPQWLHQVHGVCVVADAVQEPPPEADAIISRNAGVVCAILTADCLPVLFASADGQELAAAHAGWKGLANGVLEATVAAMATEPGDILAWIGPAISQAAFEVGDEVREAFVERGPEADRYFLRNQTGRWQSDLSGLGRQRLAAAGVKRVYGGNVCSYSDTAGYFSYRRDGECGRMASFIFRKNA
jgi:YfiH family protein